MIPSGNLQSISQAQFEMILRASARSGFSSEYQSSKHRLEVWKGDQSLGRIYLPVDQYFVVDSGLRKFDDFYFTILVIKAGQAVTACFHNGEMINHKVFRAYMVRKKQGKSQIKHLKTKGKSRAGSRVRLEGTRLFFEEINERLQSYADTYPVNRWGISCAKTLWPFLFDSETIPPFSKSQENLYPIPFHIPQASFEALEYLYSKLTGFQAALTAEGKNLIGNIPPEPISPSDISPEEDDW